MNTLTLDQFSHYLPKIGRVASLALLAILALICTQFVLKFIEWRRFDVTPEQPGATPSVPRPTPYIDYGQQVARLHLFGSAVSTAPVAAERVSESRLPLLLKGVFASTKGNKSYAIIQEQGKPQKFYEVGDEISRGVSLNAVFSEYVLVDRSGSLEKISLPRATLNAAPLPTANVGEEEDATQDTGLKGIRDELIRSPTKLTQLLSITPHMENNEFIGFRVMPSQDPGLFLELGFMEGDIVTSINGITLDGPNKSIDAIEELMESEVINLTILRDGTTISLVRSLE